MKIEKEGIGQFTFYFGADREFNNGIIISFWQTITEIFSWRKFNWNTFQFILVEFENDIGMHAYEFTFVLLCCGIRIRIPTHPKEEHEMHKICRTSMDDIMNKSCHGWVKKDTWELFKKKKRDYILVFRTRGKGIRKRLFIQ